MKRLPIKNVVNFHKELKDMDQNTMIERKSLVIDLTQIASEEDQNIFTGIISRPTVDTDGDIIDSSGVDASLYNGALQFNHSLDTLPIGEVFDYNISSEGIIGKFRFSKTYDFAVDISNLVKEKILKAISIGFIPLEVLKNGTQAFTDYAKTRGWDTTGVKRIITKARWIETSIVPVGAHPDALMIYSKSFISDRTCKALKIEIEETEENNNEPDTTNTAENISEPANTESTVPDAAMDNQTDQEIVPEVSSEASEEIPTQTSEVETKPIIDTVNEKPVYRWGNLTNENEEDLRKTVYGIWENLGSVGSFDYFWQHGKLEEQKKIQFVDLGTKRSQIKDLATKAYKTYKGLPV